MRRSLVIISVGVFSVLCSPAFSREQGSAEYNDDANGDSGNPNSSTPGFNTSFGTSGASASGAEFCLEQGKVDEAIKLCQQALEQKDDPDLHQIYAKALQQKLESEDERDPTLFRKCIAQWLMVLRQTGGEESLTFHGIGIPGEGKFWEDEDRSMPAKQQILHLTGHLPKIWETNEKFLNRVSKESRNSVLGNLVKEPGSANHSVARAANQAADRRASEDRGAASEGQSSLERNRTEMSSESDK
jgi:hypothetical protein